jgi:hypothetical protein
MEAIITKRFIAAAVLLLAAAAALCGCRQAGTPAPSIIATPTAVAKGMSSYPPDKTASQDMAGANTKLPEAATAASTVKGSLAP